MKTNHIARQICQLCAMIFISLSVSIVLLHSVVPHHHHDQCDGDKAWSMVCEEELLCHCDEGATSHGESSHHHDGHQPFDLCSLQKLLSHLVLTTQDDRIHLLATHHVAASHHATSHFSDVQAATPATLPTVTVTDGKDARRQPRTVLHDAMAQALSLRAPPLS